LNTRKKTSAMVESAFMTAIAVVLAFAGIYIPFLGFATILLPVPFIIIGVKHGLRYNLISLAAAGILTSFLSDILMALGMVIIVGFGSVVMTYSIRKKYSFNRIIFSATISSLVGLLIIITVVSSFGGVSITERFEEAIELSNEINRDFFSRMGLDSQQLDEAMEKQAVTMDRMLMIIPVIMISAFAMNALINYVVAAAILRRMNYYIEKPTKLSYFRLPENFFVGTIIIMALTFIMRYIKFIKFDSLVLNIIVIFSMIYLVQGLAVVSYFIEKRGVKNALRRTILVFLFLIPAVSNMLPYLGLFDIILNIRKLES